MMLHEMPAENVQAVIAESLRLLRPNGLMIHLDFLPPDDEFLAYLHFGHSYRNNEPWMRSLAQMDVGGLLSLGPGTVLELDRKVGEAIDIYVNNRLVARGEVVLVDDKLGVTMTEIIKAERT